MKYLVIDAIGVVANIIVIDDATSFDVPDGYSIEPQTGAVWIGWRRVDGVWQAPAEVG